MLGRLAKWLRILGFDVLYDPGIEDRQVIRIAMEEGRTILTRDTGLARNKGVRDVIFVTTDRVSDQLREIAGRLPFAEAEPSGRCAVCNGVLSQVTEKGMIRNAVPDFVYHNFSEFLRCSGCGKVYWEGSHQEKFRERIRDILRVEIED
jgi:uncharacterized protein